MLLSSLYRLATDLGAPFIHLYLRRRLAAGREDPARFQERRGYAAQARPPGRLIWCHAASIGEAVSLLPLVERLRATCPDTTILITTGTVTSARLLAERLPSQVIHQYIPVDRMAYVTRFLNHWHPDLVLWVESELWPNSLTAIRQRGIPAVLLNARMSDQSVRNWLRVKKWSRTLLSTFQLCLTPTENEKARFTRLGAANVHCVGNLKYAAQNLPCDATQLEQLQNAIAGRPLWVIASTHPGEEEIALQAHQTLTTKYPNLLTIIVPRHAVRGDALAAQLRTRHLSYAQRSQHQPITPQTAIYLADTMGELGLFYSLSPIVAMGGSLVPVGGHNPIEPAQLGAAIILGPHMENFAAVAEDFIAANAALTLAEPGALPSILDRVLSSPGEQARLAQAAQQLVLYKRDILDQVMHQLQPWLTAELGNVS